MAFRLQRGERRVNNIRLEDAVAGQRVARPIMTPTGTVLVQAGEVLTSAVIAGLRRKGIDMLVVEGDTPAGRARPTEELLDELEVRFAGHADNPLMMELKDVIARQIVEGAPRGNR